MKTFCFFLTLLILACPPDLKAEPVSLTREGAIRRALENQPDLKVAAIAIDRAAATARWSGRLENPTVDFNYKGDGAGRDEEEQTTDVAFSQRFPITARLKHERALRHHQILLAEAEVAEQRRVLAGDVDRALVNWLVTRERVGLARRAIEINGEILDFFEQQEKTGEVSKLDAMQAKLVSRTLVQERERLEAAEMQQRLELLKLLGLPVTTDLRSEESLGLPESAPANAAELETILRRRPDYLLALAKIDEARAALVLENAKRWDDITVSLFVEDEHATDEPGGLERNTFAGFGISIPLPLRQRNQEGIEQARLDGEAASRSVEAARFSIQAECEAAFRARSDAWELAREAAGELPALAESQLEEVRKAHAAGEAGFLQVRQAQEQLLEVRRAALDFLTDYHLAAARVRLATGDYPGLATPTDAK